MQPDLSGSLAQTNLLVSAGLASHDVDVWIAARPELSRDFNSDAAAFSTFWLAGQRLRSQLSKKTTRNSSEAAASELIHRKERELRDHFLGIHVQKLYDELTDRGRLFARRRTGDGGRATRSWLGPRRGDSG